MFVSMVTVGCAADSATDAPATTESSAADTVSAQDGTGASDSQGAPTDASTAAADSSTDSPTDSSTDTTAQPGAGTTGAATTTGQDTDVCFPDGIYGQCSEHPDCQCLAGAAVYQVCTRSCTKDAECGDAADFNGASPGCFPLNPGAADMICALVCTSPDDCPCGLSCMPSGVPNVNICSELQ